MIGHTFLHIRYRVMLIFRCSMPQRIWVRNYLGESLCVRMSVLIRVAGKFVKPAIKNPELFNGKQILAATDYYKVSRIVVEFEEITGKKITYQQVSGELNKSALPDFMAEEYYENHLLLEKPGYFNRMSLEPSLKVLEEKPTSWKAFLQRSSFAA